MQTVLNNVDGAIDFIVNAERDHPNRIDTCRASTSGQLPTSKPLTQGATTNPFSATQGQRNPFGAPSQPTSTPAFGAPSTTTQGGAFGQPSALGQKPSVFGGGAPAPAFGGPSQLGAGAFGRPSALGQKPTPFGAPSSGPSSGSSSGPAAPFSSFAGAANPFSRPQQPPPANAFGAPSNPSVSTGFKTSSEPAQQNPFGQTANQPSNPFGSPQQNPFGTAPAPFGAPAPTAAGPFGQPTTKPPETGVSAFANGSARTAFGQTPAISNSNPFGGQQATAAGSPMDTRQIGNFSPLVNGTASLGQNDSLQHPALETYSSKGIDGRLAMFKGMRVVYSGDEARVRGRDGTWQKIWFPHGAPAPYKDTEMEDSKYNDSIKASYTKLQQTRSFEGGIIPLIPPRREWCTFDF